MKTVIKDNVFITKFAYTIERDEKGNPLPRRTTTCYVRMGKVNDPEKKLSEVLVKTTSRNGKKENFSRANGRLVAFRRAMLTLFKGEYIGYPVNASEVGVIAYSSNIHLRLGYIGLSIEDQPTFWEDFRKQCPSSFK